MSFLRTSGIGTVTLAVGVLLALLSSQRSTTAFLSLSAPVAIFQLEQGTELTSQQLTAVEEDLRSALSYAINEAELNSQLSYISLQRMLKDQQNTAVEEELMKTLRSVEAALKARPLDAYLWTRYTHISYLLDGLSPYTLAALDRSFQYGSKEKQLFQFQMTLCLTEWERLPLTLREKARKQIEFGASHPRIWGYILADLPEDANKRLLGFLAQTSANIERVLQIERSLRRRREAI